MRGITRSVLAVALIAATAALSSCTSGPAVEPTGETTTVTVTASGMSFTPDRIEVPAGDRLVVEFVNDDSQLHDIVFDGGAGSDRLASGQSATVDVGVISADGEFWCSIPGHREMGMEGEVVVVP